MKGMRCQQLIPGPQKKMTTSCHAVCVAGLQTVYPDTHQCSMEMLSVFCLFFSNVVISSD